VYDCTRNNRRFSSVLRTDATRVSASRFAHFVDGSAASPASRHTLAQPAIDEATAVTVFSLGSCTTTTVFGQAGASRVGTKCAALSSERVGGGAWESTPPSNGKAARTTVLKTVQRVSQRVPFCSRGQARTKSAISRATVRTITPRLSPGFAADSAAHLEPRTKALGRAQG
jgi:hypothetical protein